MNVRWNKATLNSAGMFKPSAKVRNDPSIGESITARNKVVPMMLYMVWKNAVWRAVLELPNAAIHDVKHVPMFAPATKQNAFLSGKNAPEIKKTTIAVTTDDDCITAVSAAPIKISKKGFSVKLKTVETKFLKSSFSTFESKSWRPMNKTPNPATISPKIFQFFFLERSGMAPTKARKAKYGVNSNEDNETINEVTVVPIFAPIIHAQAWNNVMIPKSASLTKVTAVTSEDCVTTVYKIPDPIPPNLFFDANPRVKKLFSFIVALTRPFDIKLTPTKKHPTAVKTSMIERMVPLNPPVLENVISELKIIKTYYFLVFFVSAKASATTWAPVMKSLKSLGIKTLFEEPCETTSSAS